VNTTGSSRGATLSHIGTFGTPFNTNGSLGHTAAVTSLTITPSGLLISGGQDGRVLAWNTTSAAVLRRVEVPGQTVNAIVNVPVTPWFSSAEMIAVGYSDSRILLWDASTGDVLRTLVDSPSVMGVYSLAVLPEHTLVAGGGDGKLSLWDPVTGTKWRGPLQVGCDGAVCNCRDDLFCCGRLEPRYRWISVEPLCFA
jgi:WD40 repeat protein